MNKVFTERNEFGVITLNIELDPNAKINEDLIDNLILAVRRLNFEDGKVICLDKKVPMEIVQKIAKEFQGCVFGAVGIYDPAKQGYVITITQDDTRFINTEVVF